MKKFSKLMIKAQPWTGFIFGLITVVIVVLTYLSYQSIDNRSKSLDVKQYIYEAMDLLESESKSADAVNLQFNPDNHLSLKDNRERLEQVRRLIEKIALLEPENENIPILRLIYYAQFGDMESAKKQLMLLHKIGEQPSEASVYTTMGMLFASKMQSEEASTKYFEKALELSPHDASIHGMYGLVLHGIFNNDAQSIKEFRAAVNIDPENPDYINSLAHALTESGTSIETEASIEAEKILRKAISQGVTNSKTYNGLGTILALKGEHKEAIEFYKQAIELTPENGVFHYNIKLSYEATNDLKNVGIHSALAKRYWDLPIDLLDEDTHIH